MIPRFLLLFALPLSSFAGVIRMPALETAPRLAAPIVSPPLSISAPAAPSLPDSSLLGVPTVIAAPAPSAVPALESVRTAAAALPDSKLPAASAKSAVGKPFDATAGRASESDTVVGSFALTPALESPAAGDLPAPAVVPPSVPAQVERPFFFRHYWIARLIIRPFVRLFYKTTVSGLENLPSGTLVIVPNHIAYVDPILISVAADRPMRFIMERWYYDKAPRFFRALGAIPISEKDGPKAVLAALNTARDAVRAGQSVVIFPEGRLTSTGAMTAFKRGFERIVAQAPTPVPVIPAYMDGMWGSLFSLQRAPSLWSRLRQFRRPVSIRFGSALSEPKAQNASLAVAELGVGAMDERVRSRRKPLVREFIAAAGRSWTKPAIADSLGTDLTYGKTLTGAILLGRVLDAELPGQKNAAVLLPPSAGGALVNLALSSIGRVPVNLNYTASLEAVEHALKSAGLRTIVTSRRFLEALKSERGFELPPGRKLVFIEDLTEKIPAWKKTALYILLKVLPVSWTEKLFLGKAAASLDETATILFTSGSSALPKGVVLTHANVISNIEMLREVLPWAERDAVLGVLPFFHAFGYTGTLWLPLVSGMSAAYHANPLQAGAISKLAAKTRATILMGTPAFLQLYAKKIPAASFASLRFVIAGAEKLRDSVAKEFMDKFGTRPYEGYGATELSLAATASVPNADEQTGFKPGSPGRALPGGVIKAVNPDTGALLPQGKIGMLMFKGPNVMKGYLGEPGKTAEVVKNGWYATGDLGSVDNDGFVTISGRLSRFSKIGGEMISHTAVEEKLQQASGLADTAFVVAGVKDEKRGEKLVVLYAGWNGDIDALLAKMRENGVPNLWLPARSSFHKIEKIPLLGTGKLDLKAVNELATKLEAVERP